MTEEVKNTISSEAKRRYNLPELTSKQFIFYNGAEFGYSLCSEEKDKEIERLKGLIQRAHTAGWLDYPDPSEYDYLQTGNNTIEKSWEKFKTNNNL